ncbi:hypothetical protein MMC21_003588 [Puttea exsequens]|nr:hypothetical protein [Puttea exsequens]
MAVTHYKPVWIARSDGELEIKTSKHGREYNGPTDIQLNKDASEDDYYELLPVWHDIAQEWKRILGGMLYREQKGQNDQRWMLVDFPENYRLYRRIKKDERSDDPKSNKLPEAWLYGYPLGRKRRYRSAVDFFPHLLWLAQGKSDDRSDCSCKYCAPEWVQELKPLPGRNGFAPHGKVAPTVKKENAPIKPPNALPKPQVVIQQRPGLIDNKTAKPTITQPSAPKPMPPTNPAPPRPAAPPVVMPTPLPPAKSYDQDQDAQMGRYVYRSGELTWFNRGTAWGLSVIIKRGLTKNQRGLNRPWYEVQPLSHPFTHPPVKRLESEADLRPWLAWSAPSPTHAPLATANLTYSTVDWKAVLGGRYGPAGDAEVDGSIFAAKMIDDSFSLVEPLANNTTTTGERTYNGIFLGGEKVWVGEPIRLRVGNGQDIMIIHQIVEKLKPNSTSISSAAVHLIGDIYRYTTMTYTPGQEPAENPHLPLRLRQDLLNRNRITIASKRTISYWKIVQAGARLGISDMKGRWYESMILLPILHGQQNFDQDVNRGEISDVGSWINGRGDATGMAGKAGTRYKDRLDAIGKAVPAGTIISKGEGVSSKESKDTPMSNAPPIVPVQQELPEPIPTQVSAQHQGQHVQGVSDGDIAEFMDLDKLEDGYAQNYVEHDGQF